MCRCPQRPEEGFRSLQGRLTDSCELPDMGAGIGSSEDQPVACSYPSLAGFVKAWLHVANAALPRHVCVRWVGSPFLGIHSRSCGFCLSSQTTESTVSPLPAESTHFFFSFTGVKLSSSGVGHPYCPRFSWLPNEKSWVPSWHLPLVAACSLHRPNFSPLLSEYS